MPTTERIIRKRGFQIEQPFRWTLNRAITELKVTGNKVRGGLRRNGVSPGSDGKFSSLEIFRAIYSLSDLEAQAKRAVLESKIDEAAYQRNRRLEQQERLMPTDEVQKYMTDLMVTLVQHIRHSSMTADEKATLIDRIGHINLSTGNNRHKKKQHLNHNNGQDE